LQLAVAGQLDREDGKRPNGPRRRPGPLEDPGRPPGPPTSTEPARARACSQSWIFMASLAFTKSKA